ncbi:MAG: glycogen-binding domain-containing protein [Desulfobulbaceae bacterium]|nr:glycogen-binding domain-containing protein [Desulfobulbaceae bacterium]
MNYFTSMYIDNELSLNEKIDFIKLIHDNEEFKDEAISFIEQEKMLAAALNTEVPVSTPHFPSKIRFFPSARQTISMAIAACLLIITAFMFGQNYPDRILLTPEATQVLHRFVIYQEGSKKVEIIGSFTGWQRIPLQPVGNRGYWEISLEVPPGEHRFSYILDNETFLPDPTVSAQEEDDFGSANSILSVET